MLKSIESNLDKQTAQIQKKSSENSESLKAQLTQNEPIIKQAKAFGLIAAIMSIVAAVISALGLFM